MSGTQSYQPTPAKGTVDAYIHYSGIGKLKKRFNSSALEIMAADEVGKIVAAHARALEPATPESDYDALVSWLTDKVRRNDAARGANRANKILDQYLSAVEYTNMIEEMARNKDGGRAIQLRKMIYNAFIHNFPEFKVYVSKPTINELAAIRKTSA